MKITNEKADAVSAVGASVARGALVAEPGNAAGVYHVEAYGPAEADRAEYVRLRDHIARVKKALPLLWRVAARKAIERFNAIPLELKWADDIRNAVTTEGGNALLTHAFKGSSYTATMFLGLIESTGYGFAGANGSGVAITNVASAITAAGGASPANGWNEATSAMCASRGTPSFGTASAKSLALSSALAFSILATCTIKGCFLMIRSAAGTAATATVGNTNGAIYSAGLFTGGDKTLANGDTLNVSYTASV